MRAAGVGLRYLAGRRGPLGESYVATGGVFCSDPALEVADAMVIMLPALIKRGTVGARVRDVVVPFEAGAGRPRDGEHDELIDRARQRALELQEEAQLLDPARELRVIEQREIGAAEAFAARLAPCGHGLVQRLRVDRQRRDVHVQHGHARSPEH